MRFLRAALEDRKGPCGILISGGPFYNVMEFSTIRNFLFDGYLFLKPDISGHEMLLDVGVVIAHEGVIEMKFRSELHAEA